MAILSFSVFYFFLNSEFETACSAVAWHLSFSVEYHKSPKMPVALLRGSSQLFQLFYFFLIVSSKQPVALLRGISVAQMQGNGEISYVSELPVELLRSSSQLFVCLNSEFETACCAVAWHLIFLVEYHTSLRMPVALLRGSSQLFHLHFFLIVSSKQPVAQLHGISAFKWNIVSF